MQQGVAANVPNVEGIEAENQPNKIAFEMPQIEPHLGDVGQLEEVIQPQNIADL